MQSNLPKPNKKRLWLFRGLWTFFGGIFGYIFWQLFGYGRRLLRQPFLQESALPTNINTIKKMEDKAAQIAATNLQAGVEKRRLQSGEEKLVLCAGLRNFREPWARDFSFASFGLLELGQPETVKECLEVFLINQKPSGQFPVKVHSTSVVDRYLHSLFKREQPSHIPLKPKYITAHNTISLDGNALLVVAFINYVQQTKDESFARQYWPALKQAITWLEGHALEDDGLLHQAPFADWADSIARRGRVLYTNMVYWKALHSLAKAAQQYNYQADYDYYKARATHVKTAINEHFWRDDLGYYVTNYVFNNLSSSGNLLAVAWGLTTPAQATAILDNMATFEMADPVPTKTTHRPYPSKFIALENRLGGIPNYHTSAAWLWLGAWHVIALTRINRMDEANLHLARIAKVIVRDGAVHEVYMPSGQYLSSFWYTSEAPLTWSAGMVVHAYHVYQRHLQLTIDD